jgi:hypothetical protein
MDNQTVAKSEISLQVFYCAFWEPRSGASIIHKAYPPAILGDLLEQQAG